MAQLLYIWLLGLTVNSHGARDRHTLLDRLVDSWYRLH